MLSLNHLICYIGLCWRLIPKATQIPMVSSKTVHLPRGELQAAHPQMMVLIVGWLSEQILGRKQLYSFLYDEKGECSNSILIGVVNTIMKLFPNCPCHGFRNESYRCLRNDHFFPHVSPYPLDLWMKWIATSVPKLHLEGPTQPTGTGQI